MKILERHLKRKKHTTVDNVVWLVLRCLHAAVDSVVYKVREKFTKRYYRKNRIGNILMVGVADRYELLLQVIIICFRVAIHVEFKNLVLKFLTHSLIL